MIKRIAITGPESTGKSELAERLARHYNTVWVPEYAREYIDNRTRPYDYEDILVIAKEQLKREEQLVRKANNLLFCDTELIVTKIWCEVKFKKCHDWILKTIEQHTYDIYLLCKPDIQWKYDPQREDSETREQLFQLYLNELNERNLPYAIISGTGEVRVKNAIKLIDSFEI
ncbi:MAG: ATP-binding protein [Bacteroidetes bacterium]|nr:ATP-binding protein [Bacteroidota bacterium]MBL7102742.1 ATP-binding protein [Bacteroidales bacterium]